MNDDINYKNNPLHGLDLDDAARLQKKRARKAESFGRNKLRH